MFESNGLKFSQSASPQDILKDLADAKISKFLRGLFFALFILGLASLILHFVSPLGNLLLNFFIFSFFFLLLFWTKSLEPEFKSAIDKNRQKDIKHLFTPEALKIFRQSLLTDTKQSHPLHLLINLLQSSEVQNTFYRLSISYPQLFDVIKNLISRIPQRPPAIDISMQEIPFIAYQIAQETGSPYITPSILLASLGKLKEDNLVSKIFVEFDIKSEELLFAAKWRVKIDEYLKQRSRRSKLASLRPKRQVNRGLTSRPTPVLSRFSTDVTLNILAGRMPMIVERENELQKILQAVTQGNNKVLIVGEPGSGKTSMLQLLAQKMLSNEVPASLQDSRLVSLNLAQIVGSGTKASEALTAAMADAAQSGDVVLAAENIHEFAQAQSEGNSLLSLLLSLLQEYNLPLIATTTPQEYQQALHSASGEFERVNLEEMNESETLMTAAVHALQLEGKYNLFFTFKALEKTIELTERYLAGELQPEKTLKVLEALAERYAQKGELKVIDTKEVAEVISELANVDATESTQEENEKLLNLEEELHKRIIGQDYAVKAVASTMRRIRAQLTTGARPLASFLFVGPTGVGKTELAKSLAEIEFGSKDLMIRLDMSEFNLPSSVEKLLGGRTYSSSFIAQVREHPYSVLLLDEFEKAHTQVQNIFLQVLDEGFLTDNAGSKIDLSNTIIIATSNAASEEIKSSYEKNIEYETLHKKLLHEILPQFFRPELINRFDDVILFKPLNTEEFAQVVKIELEQLGEKLKQQKGVNLQYTDPGAIAIAQAAYDEVYGARPLRRYLQDHTENKIADWLLAKQIKRGDTVLISESGEPKIVQGEHFSAN